MKDSKTAQKNYDINSAMLNELASILIDSGYISSMQTEFGKLTNPDLPEDAVAYFNPNSKRMGYGKLLDTDPYDMSTNARHDTMHSVQHSPKLSKTEQLADIISKNRGTEFDEEYRYNFNNSVISPYRKSYNQPQSEDIMSSAQRQALEKMLLRARSMIIEEARSKNKDPYSIDLSGIYLNDIDNALNAYTYPQYSTALPTNDDVVVNETMAYVFENPMIYKAWEAMMKDFRSPEQLYPLLDPDRYYNE